MKTLLLIRHAKSSWGDPQQNDFDRPLNERGLNDAPMMAKRLLKRKINPDVFISSPAKRAKKTCGLFMAECGASQEQMILQSELYLAQPETFSAIIQKIDNRYNQAAIFSHNNGITEFVNQLTDVTIDNMPTCSVVAIQINCKSWAEFEKAEKEFLFFDYPRLAS